MIKIEHHWGDIDKHFDVDIQKDYGDLKPYLPGKIVLDLGAHVGFFTAWAFNNGAERVISVEPTGPNYLKLIQNIPEKEYNSCILKLAVVPKKEKRPAYSRYLSNNSNMLRSQVCYSIKSQKWRDIPINYEPVVAINFDLLLESEPVSVIKFDIEGMEIPILEEIGNLPESVNAIAIEWHYNKENYDRMLSVMNKILKWGFKPNRIPKSISPNGWFVRPIVYTR